MDVSDVSIRTNYGVNVESLGSYNLSLKATYEKVK